MTNSKYVPKRRFKEFELDGEWERDLFGNIADFSIKTNSFSREKLTHESYEVQNIHYGDILIKFQSVLDLKRDNLPSIIDSNVLDFRQSLLQDGDVIFADAAEDSTVGKAIEIRNIMGKNVVSGLHTIAARPIQLFAPYYLGYYLNSDFYHKQILPLMQGTKVSSISKSNLQVTEISFPIIDEQKQIGKFFQTIDSMLSLHQHKLDKLKNLKKAYLSEMFPAEGERVPKRRFPGFEGEWECRKLKKLAEFRRGSFPQPYGKAEWYGGSGSMPFVQVVDVLSNLKLAETTKQQISRLAQNQSVLVPKDSVVVTLQGSIGRVAITQYDAYVDRTLLIFEKFLLPIDGYYWALSIQKLFDIESKKAPGGTIKTITKEALSEFEVLVPVIDEQKKIGNFFKKLAQSITLQQQKLDKLNDLKKAYLNELFV